MQRIQGLIQSLTGEVARTRTAAEQAAGAFYTAQQEYFDASIRADTLQSQADLEAQNATDAANKAGRIAAQLYRDGGDTTSLELFLSGSAATADDLLSRLGVMDKLLERNQAGLDLVVGVEEAKEALQAIRCVWYRMICCNIAHTPIHCWPQQIASATTLKDGSGQPLL